MGTLGRVSLAATCFFSAWATFLPLTVGLTPVNVSIYFAAAIAVFAWLSRGKARLLKVDFSLLAYTLLLAVCVLISENLWVGAFYFYWWLISLLGYASVRTFVQDDRHLFVLVVASVAGAVIAFVNLTQNVDQWGNLGRYSVFENNPNLTAYVLSGTILMLFVWLKARRRSAITRMASYACIALIISVILTLGSRGAIISAISLTLLASLGTNFSSRGVKAIVAFVGLLSILMAFGFFELALAWVDGFSLRSSGDLSGRLMIWPEARRLFMENPIFGIGPGVFQDMSDHSVGAHNFFLTIALEAGLVGLTLMGIIMVRFARFTGRGGFGPRRTNLLALFAVYWFPIASSGQWEAAPFSWMMVAIVIQAAKFSSPVDEPAQQRALVAVGSHGRRALT